MASNHRCFLKYLLDLHESQHYPIYQYNQYNLFKQHLPRLVNTFSSLDHHSQLSVNMCFVNQSICSGCTTVTETPTPKKPCTRTPDVLQYGCNGKKVVVMVEHTGPEFCLSCYNNELLKIQKKWDQRQQVNTTKAKKQGYTLSQAESLNGKAKQEMSKEVMRLNEQWEKLWCA